MPQPAEMASPGNGALIAIGVGPGDPDLITLKGVRLLKAADVIVTPLGDRSGSSIAGSIIAPHVDPGRQQVLERVFPMRQPPARQAAAWQSIADEIASLAEDGKQVAFITLGDPMLYSTFLYLRQELLNNHPGVPVQIVPGVSSIFAAASKARLPLGIGEESLTVVPATAGEEKIRRALKLEGTVILLKVYRSFPRIRRLLQEAGVDQHAVYIRRLGLEDEKIIIDLDRVGADDLDYLSLIMVRRVGADE